MREFRGVQYTRLQYWPADKNPLGGHTYQPQPATADLLTFLKPIGNGLPHLWKAVAPADVRSVLLLPPHVDKT
jgi:hypothetical protein